jgi:hypothetical protein
MRMTDKIWAAGAALAAAAPAAAQYYPGYRNGYPYPYGGNVGQMVNNVLGGGFGANSQLAVNQCAAGVQQRLSGYPSNGYDGYGNGGGARVLGISRVEQRGNGSLTVRGVASSGRYAGYGYGAQAPIDLTWACRADYRGFISDISIDRAQGNYGYNGSNSYTPYNYDYSQYGYRRY